MSYRTILHPSISNPRGFFYLHHLISYSSIPSLFYTMPLYVNVPSTFMDPLNGIFSRHSQHTCFRFRSNQKKSTLRICKSIRPITCYYKDYNQVAAWSGYISKHQFVWCLAFHRLKAKRCILSNMAEAALLWDGYFMLLLPFVSCSFILWRWCNVRNLKHLDLSNQRNIAGSLIGICLEYIRNCW